MFSDPIQNIMKLGVTDGMRVVDIGAGSGFYSIECAKKVGPSGRVFAVDVQKDLLERLRSVASSEGIHNIEVVWANAEKIGGTKLREASADRIICSNVLFQIEKPDDFALEMKRVLKPGGKILVIDWSEVSTMGPQNIFSSAKAQTLFEKVGLILEQKFGAGDHHYGMIFKK